MANGVFQPILNQPSSPVQQLAPVASATPGIVKTLVDAGTKGVDIATTAIVRNELIGEQTTLEGTGPDKGLARSLGSATEDALIDRELTLTQIAAARKAGMSGSKARTLVDIKTRQAINKFPFLANKIRKQSSDFFGGGAGSGGFFKDAKTLEDIQAESLVRGGWATPEEARDPVRLAEIGGALTEINRSEKIKSSLQSSVTLQTAQTKQELDKSNTAWTKATSAQHVQSQVLMPAQMDRVSALFAQGNAVQAQVELDNIRRRVSEQLSIGAQNKTRQDFASSSLAVLERDWFGPMQEVINGTRTNTQRKNQQEAQADAMLNAFWAFDNKNLALWQQSKAAPANTAWDDSEFNTAWSNFMGSITNNVPFNPVTQPKKWKRAFDRLIAAPKEARLGSSTDEEVLDYTTKGVSVVIAGIRNFNIEGKTNQEKEGFVGIVDSLGKVAMASMVQANPDKFDADMIQQANAAIESEMTTLTVPIVNEELAKLGVNAANVELIARAADVRFQVKPGVMESLPFDERVKLNNAVITLNKEVTPSLNNTGRAKSHIKGSTNYTSSMKEVVTAFEAKRARIAGTSVGAATAEVARLTEINAFASTPQTIAALNKAKANLARFRGQPEAVTPESTRANLDAQIEDKSAEIQLLLTGDTATFETNKRVQELTAERKILESELKRITPEAPETTEQKRQVQIEAAGLTEEDLTELATLESFGERRAFLLSRAGQQPTTPTTAPVGTAIPEGAEAPATTFTSKDVSVAAKPLSELRGTGNIFIGQAAIDEVEKREGTLTAAQRRVVELEGFVNVPYLDKGGKAIGVGQTGEFLTKTFKESFKIHEDRVRKSIPSYDTLPEPLKAELVQAEYRGDIGISPKFRKLFNAGKFSEAATEFLNNDEFKSPDTLRGIKTRMQSVADAVRAHAEG